MKKYISKIGWSNKSVYKLVDVKEDEKQTTDRKQNGKQVESRKKRVFLQLAQVVLVAENDNGKKHSLTRHINEHQIKDLIKSGAEDRS